MKALSCIAAAAAVVLVCLPAAPVPAEDAPKASPAPSTATTPPPSPTASPAAPTTAPTAATPTTAAGPTKGSKKRKAANMTRHKSASKPYEHFVPLEQMF